MACSTITTIARGCDNNIGGIRKVWIFDMEDITGTPTENSTTWFIDAIDIGGAPIAFEFIRNSSNYTEEQANDLTQGSSFVTQTLNLVFSRREASKSKAIKVLGEGQRYLGALVLDSNGLYTMFFDLQLSTVGEGSGTAKADGSKYTVTLMAENLYLVKSVDPADAATFIATGVYTP